MLFAVRFGAPIRAGEVTLAVAPMVGLEKDPFEVDVRKLENLGLTLSLETRYRLSPGAKRTGPPARTEPRGDRARPGPLGLGAQRRGQGEVRGGLARDGDRREAGIAIGERVDERHFGEVGDQPIGEPATGVAVSPAGTALALLDENVDAVDDIDAILAGYAVRSDLTFVQR